jgi:transcriptional regulator with XRE-family HTH domain
MKLTLLALQKIQDSRSLPKKIKDVLGVSRATMWKYLKDNDDELTKAAVIKILREETGLSDEQLLEEIEPSEATRA